MTEFDLIRGIEAMAAVGRNGGPAPVVYVTPGTASRADVEGLVSVLLDYYRLIGGGDITIVRPETTGGER